MRFLVAAVLLAGACGGGGIADKSDCRLPPQPVDPMPPGACAWAKHYLDCKFDNGGGLGCLTDEKSCPTNSDAHLTCIDECGSDEYAMRCGGISGGEQPPANCRTNVAQDPSGSVTACCPCN